MSSQQNATVSLIIPAYNEEQYIGTCLAYVFRNAPYDFCEVIVVDNGSADRTAEIARKYPGVRVVREEQRGTMHARQRGFLSARGDILAFIDADTRMPAGWCAKIVDDFACDPQCVCVSGPYRYHDMPPQKQWLITFFWRMLAWPAYRIIGYMVIGGNFAMRKTALEKMRGFDTSILFYGDDTAIARRAHAFGTVRFDLRLVMEVSARRLLREGVIHMGGKYIANFFSEIFLHHPLTTRYTNVR